MKTRKEMTEAIVNLARQKPGFTEAKELTLRSWLLVSDTKWVEEQYRALLTKRERGKLNGISNWF